jgi:hypothetical protein
MRGNAAGQRECHLDRRWQVGGEWGQRGEAVEDRERGKRKPEARGGGGRKKMMSRSHVRAALLLNHLIPWIGTVMHILSARGFPDGEMAALDKNALAHIQICCVCRWLPRPYKNSRSAFVARGCST